VLHLPTLSDLPALNATLNGIAGLFLLSGYYFIRQRQIARHRASMIGAFATSTLFLISYVIYHANVGSRPFQGEGPIRIVYFTILISHIILAASVVPLALVTLFRGLKRDDARHRRIAKFTWPIWMYVSVTGVVVYWMLYQ
jgi:putative membrane protein